MTTVTLGFWKCNTSDYWKLWKTLKSNYKATQKSFQALLELVIKPVSFSACMSLKKVFRQTSLTQFYQTFFFLIQTVVPLVGKKIQMKIK